MKFIAYKIDGNDLLRTAPLEREWMEETHEKYAYRCLPLNIANCFGWQILSNRSIEVFWDGSNGLDGVKIKYLTKSDLGRVYAHSHFGYGILTFTLPYLFRTEQNINLMVTGPFNWPKDNIVPLTGIVETDWSCATFTMNWKFTRPDEYVYFMKDEPICQIVPVNTGLLEQVDPEIKNLSESPETQETYYKWSTRRNFFNETDKPGWQKDYFAGKDTIKDPLVSERTHRTKLKLKEFTKK